MFNKRATEPIEPEPEQSKVKNTDFRGAHYFDGYVFVKKVSLRIAPDRCSGEVIVVVNEGDKLILSNLSGMYGPTPENWYEVLAINGEYVWRLHGNRRLFVTDIQEGQTLLEIFPRCFISSDSEALG